MQRNMSRAAFTQTDSKTSGVCSSGLKGTYVSIEPFHLFRYLDEQAYRYNNRKDDGGNPLNDFDRFKIAMKQIVGKRLTWNQLTGKLPEAETPVD